jgi:gamma-glutamylcyclotransferase (GGCT)/AIG2-like uncharacterized protein YtfP
MEEFSSYLFVYGTLLDNRNEFAVYMTNNCTFYKDARFSGNLYDIGEYPGVVPCEAGESYVSGKIFLMNNPGDMLKRLDYYEGFGKDSPQPNEFIRELVAVETDEEPVNCWMYLYNFPVDGHWHIVSGDYMEYIGI